MLASKQIEREPESLGASGVFSKLSDAIEAVINMTVLPALRSEQDQVINRAVNAAVEQWQESIQGPVKYTREEVCRMCGSRRNEDGSIRPVEESTFHRWVNEGKLRAVKQGGRTFVLKQDLDEFMKTRKKVGQFKHED